MDTVLVLGGGAREHVLAGTLAQSPLVKKVIVAPGNGGTATHGGKVENSGVSVANHSLLVQYCADHNVSMVVVGPEAPLAAGVSDDLVAAGVRCFGPSARAARLESSKAFAKAFMERHGIPTARWEAFTEPRAACAYINSTEPAPLVVKASGLAGGKGVVVARDREEACRVVMEIMQDRVHGDAGETVLVEEVLEGEEISCMCFTDGRSVVMMPPAQDHKRVGEGDTGPNTGGMGAYAPTPQVSADLLSMVQRCVLQKTVDGMMEEGNPYIGVLYAGLMLTKAGPKVLEFNCRFGDPECQVLLPLLKSDLYAVVRACASGGGGSLADERVEWWSGRSAVTVVMASRGYPGDAPTGFPITGISRAQELGCLVFHGATKTRAAGGGGTAAAGAAAAGAAAGAAAAAAGAAAGGDDDDDGWRQQLVTSGGRVLSVTAVGRDLLAALTLATSGIAAIHFQGAFHRRDIAHRGLAQGAREAAPILPPLTYAGSGVDIDAADALVTSIKPLAAATARPGCGGELGGFGALFDLKAAGFTDPILVSGTDGVGTKLKVAEECGRLEGVGQDLVAMCVNDVLCHGAEPLFFLDYLSCGRLHPPSAQQIIGGIARACSLANCSLAGGETAEMPGAYPPGAHDLAGFAVGAVERARCLPRLGAVRAGDAVVAVASSGLHSNGFSLARRVVERARAAYGDPAPFCTDGTTLGEALLVPTRVYVRALLPVLRGGDAVRSVSHITGGGLPGNVTRGLPPGLGATLDASLWEMAPVFGWLWRAGRVPEREMARTFNLGLGAALVCDAAAAPGVVDALREAGERAWVVGQVVPVDKGEERIKISGLTSALEAAWVPPGSEVTTKPKVRVAVLISGTGTNLQALVEHTRDATRASVCEVVLVVSNVPGAGGLARATRANIATRVCDHRQYGSRSEFESDIDGVLAEFSVDVVCLAGFMRILTPPFVRKWQGRMLNIHPSLLPAFRGTHALRQALQAGARLTGCTVHFVSEEVDTGGIVAQEAVAVETGDTEETLGTRVREAEHRAFPAALELVARGNATLVNGRVVWV